MDDCQVPVENLIGKEGQGEFEFYGPRGVCVDSENRLAVADFGNHRVVMLSGLL